MLINKHHDNVSHSALALGFGILGAVAGLYFALHVIGPTMRYTLGTPHGFNGDYATRDAWVQARAAQIVSLGLIFFVVGLVRAVLLGRPQSVSSALWTASPLSVGFGYWFFQRFWSGHGPGEYFGYAGLALLALLAPIVLAPSMLIGNRVGRYLRRTDGGRDHVFPRDNAGAD